MNAATTTAQAVHGLCTPEQHTLAAVDGILHFSSVLSPAQCALLKDNAGEVLHYIARQLEDIWSAA